MQLYIPDIIDAANRTVITEYVATHLFEPPRHPYSRPENIKIFAEIMKSNKWNWDISGPIYGTCDGEVYGVYDGNHRLAAAKIAGINFVPFKNVTDILKTAIANKKAGKPTDIDGIRVRTKQLK